MNIVYSEAYKRFEPESYMPPTYTDEEAEAADVANAFNLVLEGNPRLCHCGRAMGLEQTICWKCWKERKG